MAVQLYDPPSRVVSLGNNKARKITHLHKHSIADLNSLICK